MRHLALLLAISVVAGTARAQPITGTGAIPPVPMPPGMQLPPQPAPSAKPAPPPPAPAPAGWETRGTADVQALDKVDDKVANLSIPVNQSGHFGHLTIAVRACVARPADQAADAAAFLDIVDPRPNAPAFHGWMLVAEPAASVFQHPVYDVRVTGCH